MARLAARLARLDELDGLRGYEVARTSSAPELARRCREVRNDRRSGPERDRAQRVQRRLHAWYDEENMFRNILSLWESHHDAHHRGEFSIRRTPAGDLEFLKANGEVFGTLTGGHWKLPKDRAGP